MGLCASKPKELYATPGSGAKEPLEDDLKADTTGYHIAVAEKKPLDVVDIKIPEAITAPPTELIGNLLDPVNGPACGLPYKVHYLGPPRPPCEVERLATARALGRIDDPSEDPEITNILRLCGSIFQAPASLCALFDDQRVFISEQDGDVIPRGNFPWRWTLCGWSLAFKNPQILVIPDTQKDVRFANNIKITEPPHVRFYCGAPLVASNGHRLGTLCFADVKPREFDAASCMIMNNLSELVVRQLEKGIALKNKAKQNNELASTYGHLQRAFDAFDHCVVLLEVSPEGGWKILYTNAALLKLTGYDHKEAVGSQLTDLFEDIEGNNLLSDAVKDAVAKNKSYHVKLARAIRKPDASGSAGMHPLSLHFRPAAKEALDEHVMPIGIPSFLPQQTTNDPASRKFYFMTVDMAGSSGYSGRSSAMRSSIFDSMPFASSSQMEGLDMGHLLGKGTFGSVYYGTWFGTPVAVKIIEADVSKSGPMLEAVLSQQLKHPLVVSTLKYFHRSMPGSSDHAAASSALHMHDSVASAGSKDEIKIGIHSVECTPASKTSQNSGNGWAVIDYAAAAAGAATGHDEDQDGSALCTIPDIDFTPNTARGSYDDGGKQWRQTWLIMEYADRGSLQEAMDRGWFCLDRACVEKGPNMEAVLATASEMASALQYLHACSVVHGDLSGWNIMLCSGGATASAGGRHFVAKIADFGLARSLDFTTEVMTNNYGTLTHQPPETLTRGIVSKATDVYSFGVLLWQMFTGSRPWSGLSHAQIIMQVGNQGAKLKWPKSAYPAYRSLAETCMHGDVSVRPTFEDIVKQLEVLQAEVAANPVTCCMEGEWC